MVIIILDVLNDAIFIKVFDALHRNIQRFGYPSKQFIIKLLTLLHLGNSLLTDPELRRKRFLFPTAKFAKAAYFSSDMS